MLGVAGPDGVSLGVGDDPQVQAGDILLVVQGSGKKDPRPARTAPMIAN